MKYSNNTAVGAISVVCGEILNVRMNKNGSTPCLSYICKLYGILQAMKKYLWWVMYYT